MYKRLRSKQDNSQSVAGHDWLMSPIHQQEGIALSSLLLSRGKKEIEFCKPPDTTEKKPNKKKHGGVYIPFRTNVLAEKNRPCSPPPTPTPPASFLILLFFFTNLLPLTAVNQKQKKNTTLLKTKQDRKAAAPVLLDFASV